MEYRKTTQVAGGQIPLDVFARFLSCLGRDDPGGEEDDVEGFRRKFDTQAAGLAHRRQISFHERQPGSRGVAKSSPDHCDVRTSGQGLRGDGSAEAVGPTDDGHALR